MLIGTMKERVPMIKIFKSIAVASVAASLTVCASPEVVDKRQMGDEQLSCMQLASEIQEAHEFERNAQKKWNHGHKCCSGGDLLASDYWHISQCK